MGCICGAMSRAARWRNDNLDNEGNVTGGSGEAVYAGVTLAEWRDRTRAVAINLYKEKERAAMNE